MPKLPLRRADLVHVARLGMAAVLVWQIHWHHLRWTEAERRVAATTHISIDAVRRHLTNADQLVSAVPSDDELKQPHRAAASHAVDVLDAAGNCIGHAVATSPAADDVVGFSGPTNLLAVTDADGRLAGVTLLSSRDTRDHVQLIERDPRFMASFVGKESRELGGIDAVSGATLTSLAIVESLQRVLGGRSADSLKFPRLPTLDEARRLFPLAVSLERDAPDEAIWHVLGDDEVPLGWLVRAAPGSDSLVGYQGPTDSLLGVTAAGVIAGALVRDSYDNEPYVGYVRQDESFLTLLNERPMAELVGADLKREGIEGVSGATMTSLAVAKAWLKMADQFVESRRHAEQEAKRKAEEAASGGRLWGGWRPSWADVCVAMVTVCGVALGLSRGRGNPAVRGVWQLVLIGYLGFWHGALLSQAMFVGWAQSGVPWTRATGLVVLAAAAVLAPPLARVNIYCAQLCPHGAAQQLLKRRGFWQVSLSPRATLFLTSIPWLLLGWVLVVTLGRIPCSLVDIEPFDAYVWRAAAWPTIAIAVTGLIASLFVPMAYCRFGCPTGALLNYLRRHAQSDRWTLRDWAVLTVMLVGGCLLALPTR